MRKGYIIDVVEKILFLNDIHTNRKELFKVLFSSPVFPSLASISQTLSYFTVCITMLLLLYLFPLQILKSIDTI